MEVTFENWKARNVKIFKELEIGAKPKEVIHEASEDILATFSKTSLIDKYDIYQHLMSYWADTMQDDMYLIAVDGWKAELAPVEGKKGETECDLVPKYLVINRYFATEKKELEKLQAELDSTIQEIIDLIEENSEDDGCFADFEKVNKGSVNARLKEVKGSKEDEDEKRILESYLALQEKESEAKKKIKVAEKALDAKVVAKYKTLTVDEIKVLVVDDKWMTTIEQGVKSEMDRISQRLARRIKDLAERYEKPLPILIKNTDVLSEKVDEHLKKMGFIW